LEKKLWAIFQVLNLHKLRKVSSSSIAKQFSFESIWCCKVLSLPLPCLFIKDVPYHVCLVLVSVEGTHGSSVSPIPGLMHCWVTDTVSLPAGAFWYWQGETEDNEAYLMLPMGLGFRASALHCLYMHYLVLLDPTCVPTFTTDFPVNITLIVYFWLLDCLLLFMLPLTCYDPTLLELLCLKYVARMLWARLGSFGSEHGMTNWQVDRFEDVDMGSEPVEWESIVPAYPSPCKCYTWRASHTTFVHHFLHRCLLHPWILLNVLQFMCCGIKLAQQEKFLDHALPTKF
jgi:hypothetical protein